MVLRRIRSSIALKLILASAIPSALVLLLGLWALIANTRAIVASDPALAFQQLERGAVLGTLLSLTFAGIAIALAARHFLVKPIQQLTRVMGRAELGEFLVRAHVRSDDELGRLSRSFNTMLARITDLAASEIDARESAAQLEQGVSLQKEMRELNQQLAAHVGEMELVLEVSKALSGTLDVPEQLETLGRQVCARMRVDELTVMLVDDATHQLVVESVSGKTPEGVRGMRFHLGEGVAGEVAARGRTLYVPDVEREPRYLHYKGQRRGTGSFLAVPMRAQGRVIGVLNLNRPAKDAFSEQELRLAEAIAAQAALSIANARLFQQTLELSFTDSLTGVANRRQLFNRLEQEFSRSLRFGDPLSLLMIDLDHFKRVNDQHGHTVGDGVLRGVALALRRHVRKIDLVARYGGEEFCVVLPRISKQDALEVAEKLRRVIAATPLAGAEAGSVLSVTVSIGVAALAVDAEDVTGLIEKADAALYEAKRLGRNRVVQAHPAARAAV